MPLNLILDCFDLFGIYIDVCIEFSMFICLYLADHYIDRLLLHSQHYSIYLMCVKTLPKLKILLGNETRFMKRTKPVVPPVIPMARNIKIRSSEDLVMIN